MYRSLPNPVANSGALSQARLLIFLIALVAGIIFTIPANAQTFVVHGRLTAFNTFPVQLVEITSRKGKTAVLSDSLGRFSIVCRMNDVVKIKSKTFRPETRRIGPDTDSLNINLIFIDTRQNREIAVGYGYVKQEDLTYAISNLQQENGEFCHYTDVFDVITGRFAGVEVENGQVIIRGRNTFNGSDEALYVVDDVIVNSISWIFPCDIKSISILKDSSGSAYGSRGANGVVIIETRKSG